MSCRHRHFSVHAARLANTYGDNFVSPGSSDGRLQTSNAQHIALGFAATQHGYRARRKHWIRAAGQVPATVPMWSSRSDWISDVASWEASSSGRAACRIVHVATQLLTKVAYAMAEHADGRTGRHCAASNSKIAQLAGCSPRSVTTVRKLLAAAGLAMEARRGTGSPLAPAAARRASIWHLLSRRRPVDEQRFCELPSPTGDSGYLLLGTSKPKATRRAASGKVFNKKRRKRSAPRPLHTQKIAAWLASHAVGLHEKPGQHVVGQICAALTRSHLDLPAWSGPALVKALNDDMRTAGRSWPNQIHRPGAFIAYRLRDLPDRPPVPAPSPHAVEVRDETPGTAPASAGGRRAALEYFTRCRVNSKNPSSDAS
jgi:hypothetical protein